MEDVVYRFRPVSRLLSEDGVSGELDSLYIYFAGVDQLNDPMEGYKDVFFEGDEIVWMNLLRNYLQCLYRHCVNLIIDPFGEYDLSKYALNVMSDAPQIFVDNSELIIQYFLSEPVIAQFVSIWPTLGEASLSEAFNYLDIIHFAALGAVTKALSEVGAFSSAFKIDEAKQASRLQKIKDYTAAFISPDIDYSAKKRLMDKYMQDHKERQLLDKYQAFGKKDLPASYYEMIAFPDKYCSALERSIYPQWYVACFMADCDNSSIWGSYGGNHKDVCLEFHVENHDDRYGLTLFAPNGFSGGRDDYNWAKVMMPFKAVSYDKAFPKIDFFNSLGSLTNGDIYKYWYQGSDGKTSIKAKEMAEENESWRAGYWAGFAHSTTVKVADWHHEREFRLIQTGTLLDLSDKESRKLKYDFLSLKGIVFGINTAMSDKCKLIARIEQLCKFHKRESFNFYQARYDHDSKKIVRDSLSLINVGFKNNC